MDSEKSQLEEQLRRMDMFNDDVNSNSRIEIALKLFAVCF